MKYAFIKGHQQHFSVRRKCGMLTVHPSGFYAWIKQPLSKRALEDVRQTALIKGSWEDSGKVYGYSKLHDDLQDQGETCCPNRVARLTKIVGIRAQIGYKRRAGSYGGKPSIAVNNTLNRQLDVAAPDTAYYATWVTDITYIKTHVSKRVGSLRIWLPLLTFTHGGLWAGQSKAARQRILFFKPSLWPYGAESQKAEC